MYNNKELFIVGADSSPYAVGLYLRKYVDYGILVQRAKNTIDKYISTIKNNVHYIISIYIITMLYIRILFIP